MQIGELDVELEKLHVAEGDIVIFRYPAIIPMEQVRGLVAPLRQWMDDHHRSDIMFVAVPGDFALERMGLEEMEAQGWQRRTSTDSPRTISPSSTPTAA